LFVAVSLSPSALAQGSAKVVKASPGESVYKIKRGGSVQIAVVVEVDPETGQIRIRKVVVGADVGRAVNPALIEAQLAGGAAFGIGNAVLESLEYDPSGQLLTGTLLDYALPLMTDVPLIDTFYQEIPAHTNPLGLRGVGECGNPGLGAAIANAVCDALRDLGVSLTALPVTPARIWGAIAAARAGR
jgi:carbon-monoxide dehydrogenase large subunit